MVRYSTVQGCIKNLLFIYVILDMSHDSYVTHRISAGFTLVAYMHKQHNTQ